MTTTTTTTHAPKSAVSRIVAAGTHQRVLAFTSLIILLIGFSLASPNFMQTSNMIAILQATSVNGVLAVAEIGRASCRERV